MKTTLQYVRQLTIAFICAVLAIGVMSLGSGCSTTGGKSGPPSTNAVDVANSICDAMSVAVPLSIDAIMTWVVTNPAEQDQIMAELQDVSTKVNTLWLQGKSDPALLRDAMSMKSSPFANGLLAIVSDAYSIAYSKLQANGNAALALQVIGSIAGDVQRATRPASLKASLQKAGIRLQQKK